MESEQTIIEPEQTIIESEQTVMETEQMNEVISTKSWLIIILISSIPILNIIMFCIWACGDGIPKTKANWAKAMLIWTLLTILLMFLYWLVVAVALVTTM